MREITEIKKVGRGERYKLFLDGEFFGVYEAEILAKHCLKSGEKYDEDFFENLALENGDYACFNRGLNALEKSMKSEKMLKSFLRERGYPKVCIEKATQKLKEYGYIDDEAFCENYIASYSSKSRRKLKYDLLAKGIAEEIIEQKLAMLTTDDEEDDKCLACGQKYMKGREFDLKTKQKFYAHLAGKGFAFDAIARAWEEIEHGRD